MLHSLDRVSRRVDESHFLHIRSKTEGTGRLTARTRGRSTACSPPPRPNRAAPSSRNAFAVMSSLAPVTWAAGYNTDRGQLPSRRASLTRASDVETGKLDEVQPPRRACPRAAAAVRRSTTRGRTPRQSDSSKPTLTSIASPYPISDTI